MGYHIGTMLIYEHFDGGEICPLCRIRKVINERLSEQYLGEGVMEDSTRKEVNELGFCKEHFDKLYSLPSKLGLALQVSTRLKKKTDKLIYKPANVKDAKKQAEKLIASQKTCVICKYLDDTMTRYYKTIPHVYKDDPGFKGKIENGNGFCIEHYAELIAHANEAGGKQKEYLEVIYNAMRKRLDRLENAIDEFCNHHDYRKKTEQMSKEAENALKDADKVVYGIK